MPANFDQRPREEYVQTAWSENPEILAAEEAVRKARAGVTAAKSAYIPDITAYARQSYQDGVPFLVRNFGTFGVNLDWDVFDFGKRRAAVREREAQLAEAEENLRRLKEEVAVAIERSYNKVERTREYGPSRKPGSEASAGKRAIGAESIDSGRRFGVRTAASTAATIRPGGLSPGELGISARLGGTRASYRPHSRVFTDVRLPKPVSGLLLTRCCLAYLCFKTSATPYLLIAATGGITEPERHPGASPPYLRDRVQISRAYRFPRNYLLHRHSPTITVTAEFFTGGE